MHAALHLNAKRHPESYPGLPFRPSWGALDTTALKVMRVGAGHLHHVGLGETQQRLTPVLDAALAAHESHPFAKRSGDNAVLRDKVFFEYPKLHPIGSKEYDMQEAGRAQLMRTTDRRRTKATLDVAAHATAPIPAASTAPSGYVEPKTYEEYKQRADAGEAFPDATIHTRMSKLRRQGASATAVAQAKSELAQDVRKALIYDAWLVWRGARL
jgi:hypothetical protein